MRTGRLLGDAVLLAAWTTATVAVPAAFGGGDATERVELIRLDPTQVRLESGPGGLVVGYHGGVPVEPEGAPDLPAVTFWFEVPPGARVTAVDAEATGVRVLASGARPRPVPPRGLEPVGPVAGPEYTRHGLYPEQWATAGTSGAMRGRSVAAVLIHPIRWDRDSGRLLMATDLRLVLRIEDGGVPALARHRLDPVTERRFETAVAARVRGLAHPARAASAGPAGPGPFQPTFRPTPDGSPVEYVIVTSDELAPEFERLADWKTEKGVPAVLRTTEWIDATYPNGIDQAERIRFFIRDAYQNWGVLWVLLAGDVDVIPARFAFHTSGGGEWIPSDLYYACLDGNWNGDGDATLGEGIANGEESDGADLLPEVAVGRAPASTVDEARAFVDKVLLYESAPPSDFHYPASIVALAERLFPWVHGADIAEQALGRLPPWFKVLRLYEESASYPGSHELTRAAAVDSIDHGFGVVLHVGHGYRNTMSVGPQSLGNGDADNFTNGSRQSVVLAVNCSSAAFDFNSIAERWVLNPDGGAVAYTGASRLAFVIHGTALQNAWFETIFVDSVRALGLVADAVRMEFAGSLEYNSDSRYTVLALTLLGDPELEVLATRIRPLEVAHPGSVALGASSLTVVATSDGDPVGGADVVLFKEGEFYSRAQTASDGSAALPVAAETTGSIELIVDRSPYQHTASVVTVTPETGPFLHVAGVSIDDDTSGNSIGDGDTLVDAGENIELAVTLRNGGGIAAAGVVAQLTADDPEGAITIIEDQVLYGLIGAGEASAGTGVFRFAVDPSAPVAYQPVFHLDISSGLDAWEDVWVVSVHRPYLEHHDHTIDDSVPRGNGNGVVEPGEEIWYTVHLRNTGQDLATGVSGTLRVLRAADLAPHPLVTVVAGVSTYGMIAEGAVVSGSPFEFALDTGVDPLEVVLEIEWTDALGAVVELLDVVAPAAPAAVQVTGGAHSITLRWDRPPDADTKGYDVWRSTTPGGPFVRINPFTADGSARYEDAGLPSLTRFYYQVVTRDSSYNRSMPSPAISATTTPPLAGGWPIPIGQPSTSSIQFAQVSGGPGMELFTGADTEYGWHADGTELVDGDDDDRTSGVFSLLGYNAGTGFSATTALGDTDRDGRMEVANVGWTVQQAFLWNDEGEIQPGWPRAVSTGANWASPILADLDGDLDLEVVVWASNGVLFAWHHDGSELADGDGDPLTDGILFQATGTSFNYSSPAVGDLDGDPELEIVVCVNHSADDSGTIHVLDPDGTALPGWPYATGSPATPSTITASPAIADLDGDGDAEIIVAARRSGGRVYVLNGDGTDVPGWPQVAAAFPGPARTASPVPADLDADGDLDIVFPSSTGQLHAWSRSGVALPGFPVAYTTGNLTTQSSPAIADIDADGRLEILFGDESGKLHVFNHDGTQAEGFPIHLPGEVRSTPGVWDLDADGLLEIALTGWDTQVYLWDLNAAFAPALTPWPSFRHDPGNTGWLESGIGTVAVSDPMTVPLLRPIVHPPFPNPSRPRATFAIEVPRGATGSVRLEILDVHGRVVIRREPGVLGEGLHRLSWDGRTGHGGRVGAGVYFYRVSIDGFARTGKLLLLR